MATMTTAPRASPVSHDAVASAISSSDKGDTSIRSNCHAGCVRRDKASVLVPKRCKALAASAALKPSGRVLSCASRSDIGSRANASNSSLRA